MVISFGFGFKFSEKMKSKDNKKDKTVENTPDEQPITKEEDKNEINYDDGIGYGIATVKGYVTVEKIYDGDVVGPDSPTYDMIYFNVTETKNDQFLSYLKDNEGKTYLGDKKFSIGCLLNNDKITYINDSDATEMKKYEISVTDSTRIMNSTKDDPVKLEIEIFKLTGGSGAPKCYSMISTINVKE
jgi:hypothetical protein